VAEDCFAACSWLATISRHVVAPGEYNLTRETDAGSMHANALSGHQLNFFYNFFLAQSIYLSSEILAATLQML
jgi:hypothetical protein